MLSLLDVCIHTILISVFFVRMSKPLFSLWQFDSSDFFVAEGARFRNKANKQTGKQKKEPKNVFIGMWA